VSTRSQHDSGLLISVVNSFTTRLGFIHQRPFDPSLLSHFSSICATIGDLHVKIWQGYDQPSYQLIKYKRMHHSTACAQTFTLQAGPHVFMLTQESSEAFMVDLNTGVQKPYCMPLGRRAVPTSYDGDRVVILSNTTAAPAADSSEAPIRTGQEVRLSFFSLPSTRTLQPDDPHHSYI
jgi:hypothetical protein